MVDVLTDEEIGIITELTVHAIDNPIQSREYPFQDTKYILVPNLDDISPYVKELRRMGWFDEIIVKPLYSVSGIKGSIPQEGEIKGKLTTKEIGEIKDDESSAPEIQKRSWRKFLSEYNPFRRRDTTVFASPERSVIQKIDLRKLDLLEQQNKEILRKLSAIGVKPYSLLSGTSDTGTPSGIMQQLQNVGSSIGSVFKRKRINVRGLDFYLSPEKMTETTLYTKLSNVFGKKIKIQINERDPKDQEVVVIKVEPVGRSPTDLVYRFLEENIKRHILSNRFLHINTNEKLGGDKFNTYIQELNAISSDIVELSDVNSYKNFVVVLRLIHMEILKEINKFIKTSTYTSSSVIVLSPWCFVENSVPSISGSPELKLYSDITERGLQFIDGVIRIIPSGQTEQIYFDENTLRTDLEQSLEAKTNTERALYTLANTFVELSRGQKGDNDTLQIMKFIFYTHPSGFPQIISRGSLQRLERSIQNNTTELKGQTYFNGGEPSDDSVFNPIHLFSVDDLNKSEIITRNRGRTYVFSNKGIINPNFLKSSYIYNNETNELNSFEEYVSYMYSIFKKFNLIFDILKGIKGDIPEVIKNELNDAIPLFLENPHTIVLITNTERSSLKSISEKNLGIEFLKDIIEFTRIFLTQINDTILYSIKKGILVNRDILVTIKDWLDIINRFKKTDRANYYTFLKDKNNYIYNIEYETHLSRAIYNAQQKIILEEEPKVIQKLEPYVEPRRSSRLKAREKPVTSVEIPKEEEPAKEIATEEPAPEIATEEPAKETTTEEEPAERTTEEPAEEIATEEPAEEIAREEPAPEIATEEEPAETTTEGEDVEELERELEEILDTEEDQDRKRSDYRDIIREHYGYNRTLARSFNPSAATQTARRNPTEDDINKLVDIFIEKGMEPSPTPAPLGRHKRHTRRKGTGDSKRHTIKKKRGRQ